jgi:hypothetical protein
MTAYRETGKLSLELRVLKNTNGGVVILNNEQRSYFLDIMGGQFGLTTVEIAASAEPF